MAQAVKKDWIIHSIPAADITQEHVEYLCPARFDRSKGIVVAAKEIGNGNSEVIFIGRISKHNLEQARIICGALNKHERGKHGAKTD